MRQSGNLRRPVRQCAPPQLDSRRVARHHGRAIVSRDLGPSRTPWRSTASAGTSTSWPAPTRLPAAKVRVVRAVPSVRAQSAGTVLAHRNGDGEVTAGGARHRQQHSPPRARSNTSNISIDPGAAYRHIRADGAVAGDHALRCPHATPGPRGAHVVGSIGPPGADRATPTARHHVLNDGRPRQSRERRTTPTKAGEISTLRGLSMNDVTEVLTPFTAIVPAAGLGTRFLPATRRCPDTLPVVDTPGISAGGPPRRPRIAGQLVIVTSEGKDRGGRAFRGTIAGGHARGQARSPCGQGASRPALIKVESVVGPAAGTDAPSAVGDAVARRRRCRGAAA